MNQLVVRDKTQEFVLRFFGGLLLLSVVLQLFIQSSKKAYNLFDCIPVFMCYIAFVSPRCVPYFLLLHQI